MVEDSIGVPLCQQCFFFGQLVQHLGISLCFPKVALVAKNTDYKIRGRLISFFNSIADPYGNLFIIIIA
jgi:hypothetical protein